MRARLFLLAALLLPAGMARAETELRIGLFDDPGSLDPATNATFVGRVALQPACDKLVDITPKGDVTADLATSWAWSADGTALTFKLRPGVLFQDGEKFDAAAVRFNLNRYLTLKGSRRGPEINVISAIDVIDPLTVKLTLKSPSAALLAQFTDRASMMLSPKAVAAATPAQLAATPVCTGAYRIVSYMPQDRVVLEKFPGNWRADQFHFDRLIFQPISDSNVRLVNLRAGQLDLIQDVSPADIADVEKTPGLKVAVGDQPAFESIMFNLTGPKASPDFAKYAAVRQAFSMALDREALNQVIAAGHYATGNQPFPPSSPWYDRNVPVQQRDVAAAKAKLASVGLSGASLDLMVGNTPERVQEGEVVQAMEAEAGIKVTVIPTEANTIIAQALAGDFQAETSGSAGRVDPDLNLSLFVSCGTPNNVGKYCNKDFDALLAQGRAITDPAARKPIYDKAIDILMQDTPVVYLFNPRSAFGMKAGLQGFVPYPDGIIHLEGVRMR